MYLQNIIEEAGFETRSYSGRGMYGEKCLGVFLPRDHTIGDFVYEVILAAEEYGEPDEKISPMLSDLQDMETDDMGRDMIVYFPDVPYTEPNYSGN